MVDKVVSYHRPGLRFYTLTAGSSSGEDEVYNYAIGYNYGVIVHETAIKDKTE
jgi:hypothetical protein